MNPNISQETYSYLNSTLNKLRDEITYVKDCDTRLALMEQRDAMKRIIDGCPFKPVTPTIPPLKVESYDDYWNEPLYPPNPARRWMDAFLRRKNENR